MASKPSLRPDPGEEVDEAEGGGPFASGQLAFAILLNAFLNELGYLALPGNVTPDLALGDTEFILRFPDAQT